jgi:hypothetical protein
MDYVKFVNAQQAKTTYCAVLLCLCIYLPDDDLVIGKGKVLPRTGHEGPEGE